MYHRFKGVSVAEISSASTNSEICCLGQAVLLQQIPRQCGFVLVLRCYPGRVSLRLPCLACASPASFCCVSGVPLMFWWAGSGEDQSVLWYLVFAWLLKGKKDTSAPAREEVVLMEVALWQQLAVGLQLTSGMKRGRHLNSDKPSLFLEVSQVTCFYPLPGSLPYMTQKLFARCPGSRHKLDTWIREAGF